jgi:hypothetical protein
MQENVTIAVIIIVLFFIITALSYGIHRLIQAGRGNGSSSSGSDSLVDDDWATRWWVWPSYMTMIEEMTSIGLLEARATKWVLIDGKQVEAMGPLMGRHMIDAFVIV